MYTIRPYTTHDYSAIAAIVSATRLDVTITADEVRYHHENLDPQMKHARWMADVDGQPVGTAYYIQYPGMYHPRKFWSRVMVLPDNQRRGIGSALLMQLLEDLHQHDPLALFIEVREDDRAGVQFVNKNGFVDESRRWESKLDVTKFDLQSYADHLARVSDSGIIIKPAAELAADPDYASKLYELQWVVDQDVPLDDPPTKMSMEQFRRDVLENPRFLPDGTMIALDGEQYVGISSLFKDDSDKVGIDITGTIRSHRRRGIALALKLRGIQHAQDEGYCIITTVNDTVNTSILNLNDKLGFVRQPARIKFARNFK